MPCGSYRYAGMHFCAAILATPIAMCFFSESSRIPLKNANPKRVRHKLEIKTRIFSWLMLMVYWLARKLCKSYVTMCLRWAHLQTNSCKFALLVKAKRMCVLLYIPSHPIPSHSRSVFSLIRVCVSIWEQLTQAVLQNVAHSCCKAHRAELSRENFN